MGSDADCDAHRHCHIDRDTDLDAHCHANRDTHRHGCTDRNCDCYGHAQRNRHPLHAVAAPDPALRSGLLLLRQASADWPNP